uniref:Thymidylate synthase n=1 Tax=Panagrellus redivivus TaxID=6233 RepID=A0A7E4W9C3_PANRE
MAALPLLSPTKRIFNANTNNENVPKEAFDDENSLGPLSVSLPPKSPRYVSPNTDEMQYLNLISDILANGTEKGDRTGTGTISKFGVMMKFNLANNTMPLLTTKRTFWKGIVEELLWFLSGSTDAKKLNEKGVKIWDGNGSRAFLDNLGFTDRREGDLGPVYGFQWRHFGAEYRGPDAEYGPNDGVDQIAKLIHDIKTDPNSRRLVLTAWNPAAIPQMALPPCHMQVVFGVSDGKLDAMMTQRSGDVGLGIPFNIASYSLLTHMIAHVTGLKAGTFTHVIADAHIYKNHVEELKIQLEREPRLFPTIKFVGDIKSIDDFTSENIVLEGYNPHPIIKMPMAV